VDDLSRTHNDMRNLLDKEIPESLEYIRTSSSKRDALLTGLLNVSRIGSAALTIEPVRLLLEHNPTTGPDPRAIAP
jgi:hypothetical protein